jgi:BMFP domain-containing protein YqiC
LAREIAGVRLALADVVTGEELREQLAALTAAVERLESRMNSDQSNEVAESSLQSEG